MISPNSRAERTNEPFSRDLSRDSGPDAGLQVVAGEPQLFSGFNEDAFQGGNGAFDRHRPDAVDTAPRSSAFSQENFMGDLLLIPASLWERTGFLS